MIEYIVFGIAIITINAINYIIWNKQLNKLSDRIHNIDEDLKLHRNSDYLHKNKFENLLLIRLRDDQEYEGFGYVATSCYKHSPTLHYYKNNELNCDTFDDIDDLNYFVLKNKIELLESKSEFDGKLFEVRPIPGVTRIKFDPNEPMHGRIDHK